MDPESNDGCPYSKRRGPRETRGDENCVRTEAEVGGSSHKSGGCLGPPEARRGKRELSSGVFVGTTAL